MGRQHKKNQLQERLKYEGEWQENDLVFPANGGKYLLNELVSKEFTRFTRSIGYEDFSFHGLRHTHCTLLLAEGADFWYVMQRLGHRSTNTTHGYAHAEKQDRQV